MTIRGMDKLIQRAHERKKRRERAVAEYQRALGKIRPMMLRDRHYERLAQLERLARQAHFTYTHLIWRQGVMRAELEDTWHQRLIQRREAAWISVQRGDYLRGL